MLIFTAVAIVATAPATAPVIWQNLALGMSVEEARRAQPNAVTPPDRPTLMGGDVCLLQLPKMEISASEYRVCVFFKDGGLSQFSLNALGSPTEPQFRSIIVGLRAKYGTELSLVSSPMGFNADWLTPNGVNISVVFFNKYSTLLNINYQVRLARDIKGL